MDKVFGGGDFVCGNFLQARGGFAFARSVVCVGHDNGENDRTAVGMERRIACYAMSRVAMGMVETWIEGRLENKGLLVAGASKCLAHSLCILPVCGAQDAADDSLDL
ncbi:MAG: hypothetical protein ACOYI4_10365 [Christensenellales bacterium]